MKVSDFIDGIKAFFLDILGYLIPGMYAIFLMSYFINNDWLFSTKSISFIKGSEAYVIIFFGYILGYVIYSTNDLPDYIIKKFSFLKIKSQDKIEAEIKASTEFSQTVNALAELWVSKANAPVLDNTALASLNSRNVRSIIMSYIPESDGKIYTFMFRSELCKNISSFSIWMGIAGLLASILNLIWSDITFLHTGKQYLALYMLLIVSSYFLLKTKTRFLAIAYKIPFSIFLATYYKIK